VYHLISDHSESLVPQALTFSVVTIHHGGDAEATGQGLGGGLFRSHRIPDTEKFGVESNTKYYQPCLRSILNPALYTCME